MDSPPHIRIARPDELELALEVERCAFGSDEEAELVRLLLDDPSAQPSLDLLAFDGERAVGHLLFTAARLEGADSSPRCSLLAPLAVVPSDQGRGVGGALIRDGLERLRAAGVQLVFVLGKF